MVHCLRVGLVFCVVGLGAGAGPNFVPDSPSSAPDYFCTWNLQGFVSNYADSNSQADAMTEANLFGNGANQNWVEFYPEARRDLILVLDDTWDIPLGPRDGRGHPMRGSLELDTQRFPSYTGTPAERLAKLNKDVQARGWRSVGLWVHSGRAKARMDAAVSEEEYWQERMAWCKGAGIDYWKVDWGAMGDKDVWRLNQWAQRGYPGLWIEHGGGAKVTGERVWLADKIGVWRTYDVNPSAAVSETIRRICCALRYPREDRSAAGLINCEDEPYIGAGLGCVYGVMRHPLVGKMPNGEADKWFRPEFRDLKRRLDEVTRAVRWHRIAQPFGVTEKEAIDSEWFRESAKATGAPARVARGGLALPKVSVAGGKDAPFVLCSRHPDGEIAIATAPRKTKEGEIINPADITLEIGELNRPIGIFGKFGSLTLVTATNLAGRRIFGQDLAGNESVEITADVKVEEGRLVIPGAVISRVGLMAVKRQFHNSGRTPTLPSPGVPEEGSKAQDISDPGMLLVVEGVTQFVAKQAMKPTLVDARKVPVAAAGGPLTILRAVWGPVQGGEEVVEIVRSKVKENGLSIEAYPDVFGSKNPSSYQRLEVEYTSGGKGYIAIANYGERLVIEQSGRYRFERAGRKDADPFANVKNVVTTTFKDAGGGRLLTIRRGDDQAQVVISAGEKGKRFLVVNGPVSVIDPSEFAVTGFNLFSDSEERIEIKTTGEGIVQLKRASLPFPETLTFTKNP